MVLGLGIGYRRIDDQRFKIFIAQESSKVFIRLKPRSLTLVYQFFTLAIGGFIECLL